MTNSSNHAIIFHLMFCFLNCCKFCWDYIINSGLSPNWCTCSLCLTPSMICNHFQSIFSSRMAIWNDFKWISFLYNYQEHLANMLIIFFLRVCVNSQFLSNSLNAELGSSKLSGEHQSGFQDGLETAPLAAVIAGYCNSLSHFKLEVVLSFIF